VPALIAAGISALKIEGRLKPADYVAIVTRHYRRAIDAACGDGSSRRLTAARSSGEKARCRSRACRIGVDFFLAASVTAGLMVRTKNRSFPASSSSKRGVYLGEVKAVAASGLPFNWPLRCQRGDGVVFEGDRTGQRNRRPGLRGVSSGPIGERDRLKRTGGTGLRPRRHRSCGHSGRPERLEDRRPAAFAAPSPDLIPLGNRNAACRSTWWWKCPGSGLRITATTLVDRRVASSRPSRCLRAVKHPLTAETLAAQLAALAATPFHTRPARGENTGRVMVPLSVLGKLRHEIVRQLESLVSQPPVRTVLEGSALEALCAEGGRGQGQG